MSSTKHPVNIITVYIGDERVYHNDYPGEWTLAVMQQIARKWMRHCNGTRYVISGEVNYSSKEWKGTT